MDDEYYIIDEDDYIIYDCEVLDDDDDAPVATLIRQGEKSTTRRVTSTLIEDKPKVPLLNEDYFSHYTAPPPPPAPPAPTPKKSADKPAPAKSAASAKTASASKAAATPAKATSTRTATAKSNDNITKATSTAKAKPTTVAAKPTASKTEATPKAQDKTKQTTAPKATANKAAATAPKATVKKTEQTKATTAKAASTKSTTAKAAATAKPATEKKTATAKQTTAAKAPAKSAATAKSTATKAKASDTKTNAAKQSTAAKTAKPEAPVKKMPVAAVKLPKDQQQKPKAAPAPKPKANKTNNLQSNLGRANLANVKAVEDTTPRRIQSYDFDPLEEIIINGKIVKLDSYNLAVNNNLENDIMAKEKATPATKKATETVIIEGAQGVPHGKFVIKRTDNDNFVFKLFSANNKVVAISAGFYTSLSACKSGIQSVINNAAVAPIEDQTLKNIKEQKCPKWIIYNDKREEVRLRLIATNGNMVATTNDGYLSKDAAKKGIDAIARAAQGADVVRNDDLW